MDGADSANVQHVTKKSSDELLRKFAEVDSDSDDEAKAKMELRLSKRRKKSKKLRGNYYCNYGESPQNNNNCNGGGSGLVERKRLLPPATTRRTSVLLRQLGRSQLRNKSLIRTIGKTWRRTVEGASRVFMEKHYNRHKRLISDAV